ncbi:MAG TPA: ribosome-associated translation inhibitor RaiA [Terriglobales bacterium]|nr:ribosome-associated translation inhibitor RaiA [Terriglobales bacterium]
MRTIVKGKNIDVPESVRQYAERKMRRLERFLDDRTDAVVELSSEQHRTADDSQIAEITLIVDGQTLRSHAAGPTHQASLDAVIDRIERQAVDAREKPRGKVRVEEARARRIAETEPANDAIATETAPEARKGIVKTKRFAIEPMFEEDALDRMEELGHHFFIFVNAESEKVCILYKRGAGDYGLIEPMIGGAYTPGRNGHRG